MKQYVPKMHKISAFQITNIDIVKPKQLSNTPNQDDYIELTGEEDLVTVSREFVAKYQPNVGDWYITDLHNSRIVSNDYFNHIYN